MSDELVNWDVDPEENDGENVIDISADVANIDDEVATLVQNDKDGNEVVTQINFSSPPLTREEATELTDRIKTTTNVLYLLIKRAHAGKAYEALGYKTFQDYIASEFDFSKVYAYRLLNQANVIAAIEERVPKGTHVYVSEPVSKKLKHVLPELIEEIAEKTADLNSDDAGAVIEDIIRERREQAARDAEIVADDAPEDDAPFAGGSGEGKGHYVADFEDEEVDFDDSDNDTLLSEDSADVRRKFDKLYNLYTGLKNINAVGEGEELISFLPPERYDEFAGLFETVIPWLQEFNESFAKYRVEQDKNPANEAESSDDADFSDDFE